MLTPKQQRFVEEYLLDLNAIQAAIRAGYSPRTANQQGPQLLKSAEIVAAIAAAKLAQSKEMPIDSEWVLNRLVEEVDAEIKDIFDQNNRLKNIHEWPAVWRQGLVGSLDVGEKYEGDGKTKAVVGTVKRIRLSDRVRRLVLIGKHNRVNAFRKSGKRNEMDGLGERLEAAFRRRQEAGEV
jgi:phage terminase small subunit